MSGFFNNKALLNIYCKTVFHIAKKSIIYTFPPKQINNQVQKPWDHVAHMSSKVSKPDFADYEVKLSSVMY